MRVRTPAWTTVGGAAVDEARERGCGVGGMVRAGGDRPDDAGCGRTLARGALPAVGRPAIRPGIMPYDASAGTGVAAPAAAAAEAELRGRPLFV